MHSKQQYKIAIGRLSLGAIAATVMLSFAPAVPADSAGAFIGGMLTSRVLHNMSERTQAEQAQAEAAQRQAAAAQYQAPPSQAKSQPSVEERLNTLDQLAAKGYISKEEHDQRRKEILDSL